MQNTRAYHEREELPSDDKEPEKPTKLTEKAQILPLRVQKETLHLLYVQAFMLLCFKLLG